MEYNKKRFYEILPDTTSNIHATQMDLKKYNMLIQLVNETKKGSKLSLNKKWLLKNYDVLVIGGQEHLIAPIEKSQIRYYVPKEQLYDILYETHQSIEHGGLKIMKATLDKKYKNISYTEIQRFLDVCEECSQKQRGKNKGLEDGAHLNSRCQVDLIDFQSQADGDYKFIMVYQDHQTKFVILRPLKTQTAKEVAKHILSIFYIFGAPKVLQSENGREFCDDITEILNIKWPGLEIVYSEPRYSQFKGSVLRTNHEIENMITTWMIEQRCNNWSEELEHIQFMKNRSYHTELKKSPYEAVFREPPQVELVSTNSIKEDHDNLEEVLGGTIEETFVENIGIVKKCSVCKFKLEIDCDVCNFCALNKNTVRAREGCGGNLKNQHKRMKFSGNRLT